MKKRFFQGMVLLTVIAGVTAMSFAVHQNQPSVQKYLDTFKNSTIIEGKVIAITDGRISPNDAAFGKFANAQESIFKNEPQMDEARPTVENPPPPLYSQSLESPNPIKVRVIKENAELKLRPSADSEVIRTLPIGVTLDVIEKVVEYMKVKLPPDSDGLVIVGYIRIDLVEMEIDSFFTEKPIVQEPSVENIDQPIIPSKVSSSTMEYTDWKIKLDKAKDTRNFGYGCLAGGAIGFILAALNNDPNKSNAYNLLSGTIFSLCGFGVLIATSTNIRELEDQGRRLGYLVSLNVFPTYMQNTAGIQFSCSISF